MTGKLTMLKQPKAFYMIFFVEMWERFGYYGAQCLLTYYFVKSLGMSEEASFNTFAAFSALVYALMSVGGYVGDYILGTKRTILLGAIVLCLGYLFLGYSGNHHTHVFLALGVICAGNGLFKANPSSLLAKCYEENDIRLDGAFTLYYMAINIGGFISIAIFPYLADHYGWSSGFYLSGCGMVIAILNYLAGRKTVQSVDSEVGLRPVNKKKLVLMLLSVVVVSWVSAQLMHHFTIVHWLLVVATLLVVAFYGKEVLNAKGIVRRRLVAAFILMVEAVAFWVLYQQMPTSLNFFAIHNVERHLFGIPVQPVSYQALNSFWILVGSPILAYLYTHYGQKGKDFSMPMKFALGMVLCAFAFLILPLGAQFANAHGIVSSTWLFWSYGFQSIGELLVSGLGVSMVAQLVEARLMGTIMGVWFMTVAVANILGGFVADLTSVPIAEENDSIATLHVYSHVFLGIGVVTFVVAMITLALVPFLKGLIGDDNVPEDQDGPDNDPRSLTQVLETLH